MELGPGNFEGVHAGLLPLIWGTVICRVGCSMLTADAKQLGRVLAVHSRVVSNYLKSVHAF